ncbi:MAG TPA: hypothetical protein VK255_02245 [Patescibacteria group bacterium]|nr:hypothetical protein [Patescibacteria group bacterium]
MANINLSTGEAKPKADISFGQGGLLMLIIFLILIIGLYGAELFWSNKMEQEATAIKTEFESKYSNLTKGNPIEVIDFQNRLTVSKNLSVEGRDIRESLLEIEKTIIPGVYLSMFEYDQKTAVITLTCLGDNFNTAAKQILSFKRSIFFAEVSGGEAKLATEGGKVEFKVNLKLK